MRPDRTNQLVRSDLCSCLLRVEGQSFSPVLAVYFVGMILYELESEGGKD